MGLIKPAKLKSRLRGVGNELGARCTRGRDRVVDYVTVVVETKRLQRLARRLLVHIKQITVVTVEVCGPLIRRIDCDARERGSSIPFETCMILELVRPSHRWPWLPRNLKGTPGPSKVRSAAMRFAKERAKQEMPRENTWTSSSAAFQDVQFGFNAACQLMVNRHRRPKVPTWR